MSRTTVGRDYTWDAHFNTTRPTASTVIALSESATAIPSPNTWTVLGGVAGNEMTADGFARALATTVTKNAGAQTGTLFKKFTHTSPAGTGTARTPRIVGVIAPAVAAAPGAADTGILVFAMPQPNPPTLTGTDSLDQTVSIDLGT